MLHYLEIRLIRASGDDREERIRVCNREAEIERDHKARMDELKKTLE
jgi:hypothetical protein